MEEISPIKERILQYIKNKAITKSDFCKETGISYANIKGKGLKSEIGGSQIGKILSIYTDINPEWLLTGKGNMLREQTEQTESSSTQTDVTPSQMLEEIKALSVKIGRLEAENKMLREQAKSQRQYNPYPSVAESELKYR